MTGPPLENLVVLDFTRHLAGPFATMILRDLGARVVKIEPPAGDPARRSGPFKSGDSAYFHAINRGKESVVVDLRNPMAVDRVRRLLPAVDCVVESFRPGVMEQIGLGHAAALEANPRLVYASCSGFGQDGPYARRPAFDVVAQAMGGIMSLTGEPDGDPTRVGVSQADILGGLYTAFGVIVGLLVRESTGRGTYVDSAMLEAQMALATHAFGILAATGARPARIGNRHPVVAPFDVYRTADGHVAIAVTDDAAFERTCGALDLSELGADPRFSSNDARLEHVEALTRAIGEAVRPRCTADVVERLLEVQVAAGPVLSIDELARDPHVAQRGALVQVKPWGGTTLPVPALPFKLDGARWATSERAPELGATSLEQLQRELSGDL